MDGVALPRRRRLSGLKLIAARDPVLGPGQIALAVQLLQLVHGRGDESLRAARQAGQEYLLERRLMFRRSTGELIQPWVVRFAYPFRSFYSVLNAADHFRAADPHEGSGRDERIGDAIAVIPWQLYLHYGDTAVLRECFAAMLRWLDYLWSISDGPVITPDPRWGAKGFTFGDWLQPQAQPGQKDNQKAAATIGDDAAATLRTVEALAHALATDAEFSSLADKQIVSLELDRLAVGAADAAEVEQRLAVALAEAEASKAGYDRALKASGKGPITTEIRPAPEFFYAETYHQQYLQRNPRGYCNLAGTGVSCPVGLGVAAE